MFKQTRLYSVLFNKCPKCHKGNFFTDNNPFRLGSFSKMNNSCANCGESFTRETGFYYGAMYASYGLTVLLGILMFLIMVTLLDLDVLTYLFSFSFALIVLMPVLFRVSRLIWINIFVGPKK